ncbi:TetR/AcrR family transcriptional regulator [Saccharopolyspora flava]|uniref:TetR/AcrR family transcriptional regulator n=1 Tax=Saccharopolyspora flava TaxID=95161 RepID=UPI001FEB11FD|nr:TetR family transcriptional regulator [Saccharopolyspora flava]
MTDGRRLKGERRRRAIVDAALRVVAREGVGAVSHRNVAREAGVPPASIAYYFDGIDDLLVASLLDGCEALVEQIAAVRAEVTDNAQWPRAIAELLVRMITEHRERTIGEYELYLLAARRPALRPAARRWLDLIRGNINDGDDGDDPVISAFIAGIDGLLIQALIADEPPSADDLEPVLRFLMHPYDHLGVPSP